MKRILSLSLTLLLTVMMTAQVQQGYVKTKGVLQQNGVVVPGTRVSGVTVNIRGINSVVSRQQGAFSFNIPATTFYLDGVTKQGYTLADPDAVSRSYNYTKEPMVIVIEDPQERQEAINNAKRQIRRTLNAQLQAKDEEIQAMKDKSEQEKRQLLNQLYDQQERADQLIAAMAERYVSTDFDEVDDLNRQIGALILTGELNKADSLIRSKGDFDSREKDLQATADAKATAEKARNEADNLAQQLACDYQFKLNDLAEDYYNKYTILAASYRKDSAAYYLERRAALDSTNLEWQSETASLLFLLNTNIDNYLKVLYYYKRALQLSIVNWGEQSERTISIKKSLAMCYTLVALEEQELGNYSNAINYFRNALDIRIEIWGIDSLKAANSYESIGDTYICMEDYNKAMEFFIRALAIRERELPTGHPYIGLCYKGIGMAYAGLGNYSAAIESLDKALEICKSTLGENDSKTESIKNEIEKVKKMSPRTRVTGRF